MCSPPPRVTVLPPVGEIIIFRHFTSESRNRQHKSVFPKNAPPPLLLPKAIVEDMPKVLPDAGASSVVFRERVPVPPTLHSLVGALPP